MKLDLIKGIKFRRFASFLLATILLVTFNPGTTLGQKQRTTKHQLPLVASINAYSFADLLMAHDSRGDNQQLFNYFNLFDWCATKKVPALDATAYFFPGYPKVPLG